MVITALLRYKQGRVISNLFPAWTDLYINTEQWKSSSVRNGCFQETNNIPYIANTQLQPQGAFHLGKDGGVYTHTCSSAWSSCIPLRQRRRPMRTPVCAYQVRGAKPRCDGVYLPKLASQLTDVHWLSQCSRDSIQVHALFTYVYSFSKLVVPICAAWAVENVRHDILWHHTEVCCGESTSVFPSCCRT